MNNLRVIEEIQEKTTSLAKHLGNRTEHLFKLGELEINNGIFLNEKKLTGPALKSTLKMLGVRPEFLDYSKTMTAEDWQMVSDSIKGAIGETTM